MGAFERKKERLEERLGEIFIERNILLHEISRSSHLYGN